MRGGNLKNGWGVAWPAPGKLNLMLKIIGRREDGYHMLQTVFQFIDCCDDLIYHQAPAGALSLHNTLPGVAEEDDLVIRAARILQRESGTDHGVRVEVRKRLPMGGGLGGGSSDAATTLVVLNRLWGLGFPVEKLQSFGLRLGADVPVFVHGHSAWAEGVGENLVSIEPEEPWYTVVVPPCEVSTVDVFTAPDLTRNSKPVKISGFMSGMHDNDCLPLVKKMYVPVREAIDVLSEYGDVRLTGTGACIYLQFPTEDAARAVAGKVSGRYRVHVVRGLNQSPLHVQMGRLFGESVGAD